MKRRNGLTYGRTGGRTEGRTGGRTDERTDGHSLTGVGLNTYELSIETIALVCTYV